MSSGEAAPPAVAGAFCRKAPSPAEESATDRAAGVGSSGAPAPSAAADPDLHRDPGRWDELVEAVGVSAILVLLSSWMGGRLSSQVAVEDVWQETLWMAWRDRDQHRWTGVRGFRSWLLGIARHRIANLRDHLGARKRGGHDRFVALGGDSTTAAVGATLPARSTTPSRVAWHAERADRIRRALEALPAPLESAVRLRLLEELPMAEVAARLGIGLSAAKERFRTGLARYRRELERAIGSGPRS